MDQTSQEMRIFIFKANFASEYEITKITPTANLSNHIQQSLFIKICQILFGSHLLFFITHDQRSFDYVT